MKKILLALVMLLFVQTSSHAATTIVKNYDATKLKKDIISIYALKGAIIESNKLNEYTFSIRTSYMTLWSFYNFNKDITIIPKGRDCILSLRTNAFTNEYDTKELNVLKKELQGGYTYGLNYFIKIKSNINKAYVSDGIDSNGTPTRISNSNDAEPVYYIDLIPKSTFRGPKLINTSYNAKAAGLKANYRIVEINRQHINKYKPEELSRLLNPTEANQTIEVGYKEKCGGIVQRVTLHSQYQKPLLETL